MSKLSEITRRLHENLNKLEDSIRGRGDSVPPPVVLRDPEKLTPERCAEIGAILQRHQLLGCFGVTPAEVKAFTDAAKKGTK